MTPMRPLRARGIGAAIIAAVTLMLPASAGAREWVAFPALSARPFVDPGRILIMGWAYGAVSRAVTRRPRESHEK